jgi:hypothetical protein
MACFSVWCLTELRCLASDPLSYVLLHLFRSNRDTIRPVDLTRVESVLTRVESVKFR